jgi:hypothetical protein
LKQLFIVKAGAKMEIDFSPAIYSKGIPYINQLTRQARVLALDYYMKSEALFTEGVMMFEKNASSFKFN